jgi:exopolysaccharide biosynthesis polyprenyl glycosylphosphotransferase
MLKEHQTLFNKTARRVDILITAFSFFLAYWVRGHLLTPWLGSLAPLGSYLWTLLFILPLWWALLKTQGLYRPQRTRSLTSVFRIIARSVLLGTLGLLAILFAFKLQYISRTFIFVFGVTNAFLLISEQAIIRYILRSLRKRGYNYQEILIVGTGKRAKRLLKTILKHKEWGFRVAGFVDKEQEMLGKDIDGIKVIGMLEDIPSLIRQMVIDEVIFVVPRTWLNDLEGSILACEELGIKTTLAADFFNPIIARPRLNEFGGVPMLSLATTPQRHETLFVKQALDTTFSLSSLILLSPLFAIIALAIKLSSPGPVIYTQERSGLNGRKFKFYKFRSMVDGADKMQADILDMNEMSGPIFKIEDDPRITKVGKFLRKTSMDELPQLINVLQGNMSLVGPRPPLPGEVEQYEHWQRRRLSMKPGITCIWQVNGRNGVDFEEWMNMDMEYIDNWSLWLDFKILFKTAWVVSAMKGAM